MPRQKLSPEEKRARHSQRGRAYYLKNRERIIAKRLERLAEHPRDPKKSREYYRRYFEKDPERFRKLARARRAKDPERQREYVRRWQEKKRAKNPDYFRLRLRAWQERNRERTRELAKEWNRRNPEYCRANRALKLARKKAASVAELVVPAEIYARDRGRCHICKRAVSRNNFHIDHIIPLKVGGAHATWNVAVAHPFCNISKGARLMFPQLALPIAGARCG